MKTAGISRASNDVATVSIGEEQVYNATDWDAIYAHVQESGDYQFCTVACLTPQYENRGGRWQSTWRRSSNTAESKFPALNP